MIDDMVDSAITAETEFETVIGLEVHSQLRTESKMFCRCSAKYADAPPNTHVCPVCLALPGTLPVINARAVEWTIKTALALNMTIPALSKFDRKNYHYPDLMKGYQISQFDLPFSQGGYLDVEVDGESRHLGITRVHLEEDTARLLHRANAAGETYSLVDVNRSGVPLMEIVSEPDMRSPDEARAYLVELRKILRYLGVSTADMEKGSFRCDANISLRPQGSETLGTKVEVKNMNSFRAVHRALEFEVERQTDVLHHGGRLIQETRGWVEDREETVSQRSKEYASDYRYFPEPDLPPATMTPERVEQIRAALPELPAAKRARLQAEYDLPEFEVGLLAEEAPRAAFYEEAVAALGDGRSNGQARAIANWMVGDLARLMHERGDALDTIRAQPLHLAELVQLIDDGTISNKIAKSVFETMYETGDAPKTIVETSGQTQISGDDALTPVIAEVIAEHASAVDDYRAGKDEALKFLVGMVMKATKGRANPQDANRLLLDALERDG